MWGVGLIREDFLEELLLFLKIFFIIYLFIYLFILAASGLSCGTWHLSLQRAGFSLVVVCGLLSSCGVRVFLFFSCGTWAPERMGSVVCSTQAL